MAACKVRRIVALLLAVTLVVTGTVNSVQAADMTVKMTAVATDMPMPGGCNGCSGDDHGLSSTSCFTLCGGVTAILQPVPLVAAETLISSPPSPTTGVVGLHGPPDPYPPRPISLS
jgi:hypothetical protein